MKNGSFVKGAFVAAAVSLALSAASVAQAGVLTGSSLSGEGVTINYNGAATATTAGVFTGTFDVDGAGPTPAVNVLFWCVDIFKHVTNPFSYSGYTAAIFESPPLTFDATRQQNWRDYSPTISARRCRTPSIPRPSSSPSGTFSSTATRTCRPPVRDSSE